MAEREGFEPPIRFPVFQFSRLAPSTTRPSLRDTYSFTTGSCFSQSGRAILIDCRRPETVACAIIQQPPADMVDRLRTFTYWVRPWQFFARRPCHEALRAIKRASVLVGKQRGCKSRIKTTTWPAQPQYLLPPGRSRFRSATIGTDRGRNKAKGNNDPPGLQTGNQNRWSARDPLAELTLARRLTCWNQRSALSGARAHAPPGRLHRQTILSTSPLDPAPVLLPP
jgi:hypothetical protein